MKSSLSFWSGFQKCELKPFVPSGFFQQNVHWSESDLSTVVLDKKAMNIKKNLIPVHLPPMCMQHEDFRHIRSGFSYIFG